MQCITCRWQGTGNHLSYVWCFHYKIARVAVLRVWKFVYITRPVLILGVVASSGWRTSSLESIMRRLAPPTSLGELIDIYRCPGYSSTCSAWYSLNGQQLYSLVRAMSCRKTRLPRFWEFPAKIIWFAISLSTSAKLQDRASCLSLAVYESICPLSLCLYWRKLYISSAVFILGVK